MIEQISPRITHFSWGNIGIEDGGRMKDAKVFPGVRESGIGGRQGQDIFPGYNHRMWKSYWNMVPMK